MEEDMKSHGQNDPSGGPDWMPLYALARHMTMPEPTARRYLRGARPDKPWRSGSIFTMNSGRTQLLTVVGLWKHTGMVKRAHKAA